MTGAAPGAAADPHARLRAKLAETPIHPKSFLATDYLNHFNEPAMLLEILADSPECLEDLAAWKPLSYADHFRASGLSYAELAIEAYRLSPTPFRIGFELVVAEMNALVAGAIKQARDAIEKNDPEAFAAIATDAQRLQELVAEAGGIVQGEPSRRVTQAAIDALMGQK
ncbi:hypothetical protein FRZ61_42840 [Hypericibacter adhaerens]|uniref:Uncharacterized protein n=1 Tax=Hypericibacter adhaerens TaxID=2602016 RepID=A0A5J6N6G9_9PROT|nr:hypothetical protein [Hypericibacter adhaerens]QEX24343.1 hypothetical protein FRZ61_42840 [Hypericibacter adhaerens]